MNVDLHPSRNLNASQKTSLTPSALYGFIGLRNNMIRDFGGLSLESFTAFGIVTEHIP